MMRLDLHAHILPDEYRRCLVRRDGSEPSLPLATRDGLVEMMDRYEIDAAVLSTGPPGAFLGDSHQAREIARCANEALAKGVSADPERFAGLAVLPLPDVEASLEELAFAIDRLGLDGVMLLTNVNGIYLGDPRWDPLFEELNRRGQYVFVHPTTPPYAPLIEEYPVWLYEFPFDTTRALTNLIYSGTLERYPDVRLQFSHLGGAVGSLAHRIESLADREPDRARRAPAGALKYLERQYFDTGLSANAPALAAIAEIAPIEHIVFGTDWPYAVLPDRGEDPAPALSRLPAGQRNAIDCANAAALVPRLVGSMR